MLFRPLPTIAVALLVCRFAFAADGPTVEVRDASGLPLSGAALSIRTPQGAALEQVVADDQGRVALPPLAAGTYLLRAEAAGFAPWQQAVQLPAEDTGPLVLTLQPAVGSSSVTVTARRGAVEDTGETAALVTVRDVNTRPPYPYPTLGNALEGAPNVLVQQTSTAQVSPFLRGFTGYHVLNLVDGVRFNNATFRSGPNQYLAFLEPSQVSRLEVVLGPAAGQYGSDSLGGTLQVVTVDPVFSSDAGREIHGNVSLFGRSADLSAGGQGQASLGGARAAWLLGGAWRRHQDLRAGGGFDSRQTFTRLLGVSRETVRDLFGSRLQDTGFAQAGVHTKLVLRPTDRRSVTLFYQRSGLEGVRNYKDLLGGLGRLQSTLEPQGLDFLYGRVEQVGLGFLDAVSATFSWNGQRDGSARQALRLQDTITRDTVRVDALGYAAQATTHVGRRHAIVFGGEWYDEHIDARRTEEVPGSGRVASRRPLYPDQSRYRTAGLFGQDEMRWHRSRLRAVVGGRLTGVRYKTREDAALGVASSSPTFQDATFHSSLSWRPVERLAVHALVGRGFRAPNANDLGAVGLNDLGYEVPLAAAVSGGALLSSSAGEAATATGRALASLKAETLFNYEVGVRLQAGPVTTRVQGFIADLRDPIVRRTLLFPASAAPTSLAGLAVTALPATPAQQAQGVVTVATALDPRAVKAFVNDGQARYTGLEATASGRLGRLWWWEAAYSILGARDLNPNRPVRRLPPQQGMALVRWTPRWRGAWVEAMMVTQGAQTRLSGGDLDDERIGASRSRRDIADFFRGARAAAFVSDGVFAPTGETERQIQDRLLPLGQVVQGVLITGDGVRVPLTRATSGWAAMHLRAGLPLGERAWLHAGLENAFDRLYRVHGSGTDAPGRNVHVGVGWRF